MQGALGRVSILAVDGLDDVDLWIIAEVVSQVAARHSGRGGRIGAGGRADVLVLASYRRTAGCVNPGLAGVEQVISVGITALEDRDQTGIVGDNDATQR